MTTAIDTIRDILDNTDYRPRSYSGRYMGGRECLGITCDSEMKVVMTIIAGAMDELDGDDEAFDKIRDIMETISNPSVDSMGRSVIVYWPDIDWEEFAGPVEDEDEAEAC